MSGVIVVTGANGFVGTHLVRALKERGLDVWPHSLRQDLLDSILGSVSHVFHLAAKTYVPESWSNPLPFYEANVLGTMKVLDFCRRVGASVTVVSSYVYGKPASMPVSENHSLEPFNPYSHSKILAEQAVRYYAEAFGVPATVIRPFNLYGPFQDRRFLIPTLLQQALDPTLRVISVADARPRRDFLFITDFVDLLIRAAKSNSPGFNIFNAGSGASLSIADLCRTISSIAGIPKPLVSRGESRPYEVFDVFADISKASRELDWRPQTSVEEGLALTITAFKQMNSDLG